MAATTLPNTNKFGGLRVYNGLFPADLPKIFRIAIDLTATGSFPWVIDLSEEQDRGQLPYIQSVFIDNSLNAVPLVLTSDLGQVIQCGANAQGFFPVLASANPRFLATTSSGAAGTNTQTSIIFCSMPMPASFWKVA